MPTGFPIHEIPLPNNGLAYTLAADSVLSTMGWKGLRQGTIELLQAVYDQVQEETVAWLCPLAGLSDAEKPEQLIGLIFTFKTDNVPPGASAAIDMRNSQMKMTPAGLQPPPDMAFPAFVAKDSTIHRAWLNDPEHTVCLYLDQETPGAEVQNIGVENLAELAAIEDNTLPGLRIDFAPDESVLMPTMSHVEPGDITPDVFEMERLKIAFSWQFVYMVMNADGHVDEREKAFMARLFPGHLLSAVDLVDDNGEFKEPGFTLARTEALRVLPTLLSMPDRVELLRTLKEAAWADGVLVPAEASVYEAAADMLGVPMSAASQL